MSENWTAIYVPMPLNSSGNGPADLNETVRVEHQVWDAETNLTMFTARDETTALAVVEAWNRRTPEPEGEAVAWGCFDANGLDDKLVYRDQRRAEDAAFAFTPSMTVKPLYASPVVPVGVSEAVLKAAQSIHNAAIIYEDEALLEDAQIVLAAFRQPVVPVGMSREEFARIIDPVSWEALDVCGQDKAAFIGLTTDHSLAKADRILAALAPTDTGEAS